ncbi:PTS lactose/cellobiose transporter subunit IIA [Staphylococcus lutrae]|uniref:PTS lactose/cellobiose transporter subunit IIA n=1 Tax=Staphylococcus lutrae TaxID=155085 RepID=A0AAC9RSM5_9STAP|nr:PTS lactose/cellobiose transporter subunit IIA [Staphylococcus lutrae]ARJ51718.1 PTS lactose/cellobiose transporter subunit IIA [Staphylococcus lutrae]PNZ34188.1 PTS lactose/cellobiose transporter subunit IIA [Staphylococcus lutrae]
MEDRNLENVMQLIVKSGNAKSYAMEAIQLAKTGETTSAIELLNAADQNIVEAHQYQTKMLTQEANGEKLDVSLLVVHSQDHLMTSICFIELAKEIVEIYKMRI